MKLRYKRPFFNWLAQLFQKVSGVPPLSMPRAVAGGLKEVTAYGGCALNGIPSGYRQVVYVANAPQTLVPLGLVPHPVSQMRIELLVTANGPDTSYGWTFYIFQARETSASSPLVGISGAQSTRAISGDAGTNSPLVSSITRTKGHRYHIIYEAENGVCSLYVKDLTDDIQDTVTGTYTNIVYLTAELCIFGNNGVYDPSGPATEVNRIYEGHRVEYASYSENNQVKLDLVPVVRSADSTPGFYNRVDGTFVTATEGSLTAGTAVTPSPTSPCEIWCNNGALKVLDKSSWTIFTNPTSQAGQGVYISANGNWYAVNDNGAGCAIPLTIGRQYTLVIHKKTVVLGTMLRYGQSPQANPTSAGVQLTDWYWGSITDGQMVSFVAKLPYLVMQFSAAAVEAGMIQEAVEVLEAQGGDYTFLEYIEATGTQYIQTTLSGPARWIGAGQGTSQGSGSKCILNALTSSANVYVASRFAGAATGQFWTIAGNVQYSQTPTLNYAEYDIDFQANLFTGTINGETVSRQNTLTFTTWTIGNAFGTGGAQYPFIGHIYRQQAYQNHVLAGDFIPAIRNSDNAVGMYNAVSGTFFENAGTDVFTAGPVIGSGEVLKLTPSNDTAGVANLLKIGDYVDTQEILTGLIHHQLGIYVFTGNENLNIYYDRYIKSDACDASISLGSLYATEPRSSIGLCSHLKLAKTAIWEQVGYPNTFVFNSLYASKQVHLNFAHELIGTTASSTRDEAKAAIKNYITQQYNNGTPIIVVYPLITPQDEAAQVLQTMQTTAGDNTLEITQASLPGLELAAEYKRH